MKKKNTLILSIILLFIILCGLYLFFVPFVEYREPEMPSSYASRLTHPQSSFSFLVGKEGGLLSRFKKPSLIVYSPLSRVEETESKSLQWGRINSNATYSISFSKEEMYRSVLESNKDKVIGFLYNENDTTAVELFYSLSSDYPNIVSVTYYDRVSVVNKSEIKDVLDTLWGVIVYNMEESREAWADTTSKVIMDPVSAAAAVSAQRVVAITPEWKGIIKSALKGDDISINYTLTVLEN